LSNGSISESEILKYVVISAFLFLFLLIVAIALQKCKRNNTVEVANSKKLLSSKKVNPIYNDNDNDNESCSSDRSSIISVNCEIKNVSINMSSDEE
jgi:hypothetical protein